MYTIIKEGRFEASHILEGHKGKCGRLHGHQYRFQIELQGTDLDEIGLLFDFSDLPIKRIEAVYDHYHLNDLKYRFVYEGGNNVVRRDRNDSVPKEDIAVLFLETTSAECIAKTIFEFVEVWLSDGHAWVSKITVWETDKCQASYVRG